MTINCLSRLRLGFACLVAVLLAGCVNAPEFGLSASASEVPQDTKVVKVAGQTVTLGRAAGYCFNDKQSRSSASGAFVVMGPCDTGNSENSAKGLVIINVLAETGIQKAIADQDLEGYFQSEKGRAALSRKGNPDRLRILGTMQDDGIFYVHTRDADGPVIPDTTAEQWRVFFVVSDRLVSVSVVNFIDSLMPDGDVFAQMEEIARRIKSLN
ncbi:hypothetical protein [Neptunicoccus cionae]|uniref:hypothetical protein n=1 Tax=Neptunicoccus cionae TaxID=2035344 RepID=UPI00166A1EED|nr:hypothetical protein [Amylibacter cionae]